MKTNIDRKIKLIDAKIGHLVAQKAKLIRGKIIPVLVEQMHQEGITPRDITMAWKTSRSAPKATKPARPARYRNPETGESWSGLGKRPGWLRDAETSGRSREEFLVAKEETPL